MGNIDKKKAVGVIGAIGALIIANVYRNKQSKGEFRKLEHKSETDKSK